MTTNWIGRRSPRMDREVDWEGRKMKKDEGGKIEYDFVLMKEDISPIPNVFGRIQKM
jgi:hypothetical protein